MRRACHRLCAASVAAPGESLRKLTSFLSDIEGDHEYFERFVASSDAVYRDTTTGELKLRDGCDFVFGGDAFDKGAGDLTLAEELVALKRRYPSRVTLLLGNRDINKMQLTSELDPEFVHSQRPEDMPIPFFAPPNRVPYASFLAKRNARHGPAAKLQWMLEQFMGSDTTFELRREELRRRGGGNGVIVTDEDVLQSFLSSLRGPVKEYLQLAQIGVVHGSACFVHGGIRDNAIAFVPDNEGLKEQPNVHPLPGADFSERSAEEWIEALNNFAQHNVNWWLAQPTFQRDCKTGELRRGGRSLLAYAHQKAILRRTVVVESYLENRRWQYAGLRTAQYLNMSGIERILCGHQPAGDSPTIISQPGLQIIVADNSYCSPNGRDRGQAVQEVLVDHEAGTARVKGARADGTPFDFSADDPLIGRQLADGAWSKALLPNGAYLVQRLQQVGFGVDYFELQRDELEALIEQTPLEGAGSGSSFGMEPTNYAAGRIAERVAEDTGKTRVKRN